MQTINAEYLFILLNLANNMKPFVISIVQLTCQRFRKYFCIYPFAKTLCGIQHFIPRRSRWGC